ncbi:hypothetical protein [Plebeiibacterium marinum]|uniref:Uncharacterized protein n=1 Tax=Plebeiibacterium marinum TaxID=2992111 RepID=A0AAE3MD27_9BACT|nr:hypothetical protein [Plebeiobacterium marinum]MCW3805347.1 hypothetical protein [Plebeiobacterium marinum]
MHRFCEEMRRRCEEMYSICEEIAQKVQKTLLDTSVIVLLPGYPG